MTSSVESEHVRGEVAGLPDLGHLDPPAGGHRYNGYAPVVHRHSQPSCRVYLQSSTHTVPDYIPVTNQDINAVLSLRGVCTVKILSEAGLNPRTLLEEIPGVRNPMYCMRIRFAGCPLPDEITGLDVEVGEVLVNDVAGLCGAGHRGFHQANPRLQLVAVLILFFLVEIMVVEKTKTLARGGCLPPTQLSQRSLRVVSSLKVVLPMSDHHDDPGRLWFHFILGLFVFFYFLWCRVLFQWLNKTGWLPHIPVVVPLCSVAHINIVNG